MKNDSKGTDLLLRLDTTQDLEVDYKITTTSLSGSGGGYGPPVEYLVESSGGGDEPFCTFYCNATTYTV